MKTQELSETKRKMILWTVVVVLGIVLFFWWGKDVIDVLQQLEQEYGTNKG